MLSTPFLSTERSHDEDEKGYGLLQKSFSHVAISENLTFK